MRGIGRTIIVFVVGASTAACSFLFDMDRYEGGASSGTRTDSGGGSSSGRSEDGSIASDSSGGVVGNDASSSSGDAGPPKCNFEVESNDIADDASLFKLGENCGTLSTTGDVDYWLIQVDEQSQVVGTLVPNSLKLHFTSTPNVGTDITWQGGGATAPLQPGNYHLEVSYNSGAASRDYKITFRK